MLSPGSLDPTFGTGGIEIFNFGLTDNANAIALQSDGKIVEAGRTNNGVTDQFALARFNTDGSIDTTFGVGGRVTTGFGPNGNGICRGITIQGDGKIIAVGFFGAGGVTHFAIARYNTNGSLDSTFGVGGEVTTAVSGSDFATSVAVQSDGSIVVAGSGGPAFSFFSDFAVVRYNSDGTLNTTFGTSGEVLTPLGPTDAAANALAIQGDGKIVVVGHTSTSSGNFHFAVLRYNADGTLDSTFNGNGEVLDNFPGAAIGSSSEDARGVAIQPDGHIVAVGNFVDSSFNSDIAVARYNPDGSPDTTFNGTGKAAFNIPGSNDAAQSVALQSNGRIVLGAVDGAPGGSKFLVVRYNPDGTLDSGFGSNGIVITDVTPNANSGVNSVAIQTDGKIVAGGTANAGSTDSDFALVRYIGDVPDFPLTATGTTFSATEGVNFSGTVASFTDADSNGTVSQFTATIDWGDGTISTGTIGLVSGTTFSVSGTHSYAVEGSYTIKVSIKDVGGSTATATSTAKVADNVPVVNATVNEGVSPLQAVLNGTFSDTGFESHTVVINWGDGTSSTITLAPSTSGSFSLVHMYTGMDFRGPGTSVNITVTVLDDDGTASSPFVIPFVFSPAENESS